MFDKRALFRAAAGSVAGLVALTVAGGALATQHATAATPEADAAAKAIADIKTGDIAGAHKLAEDILARDPRNARMHFLNGLAYHLTAERGDASAYDLAKVGYETSLRFDPHDFWANDLLGVLDFERGDWQAAQQSFAAALIASPDSWRALAGLAAASYYAGDAPLAMLAADRAAKLAPHEAGVERIAALAASAGGDFGSAGRYLATYQADGGGAELAQRIELLKRTAPADAPPTAPAAGAATGAAPAAAAPPGDAAPAGDQQLQVEVTIILADDSIDRGEGLNLLSGLQMQFGYSNSQTSTFGHPAAETFLRTITQSIAVPQVTYSLNVYNRTSSSYWVLSRPTLTAFLGEESDFFVGRTISVPVSGVNLGTLQSIDAGTTIKLTPQSIEGERVKFKIDASRSFFDSSEQIPGFAQQINVFKESASATAQLNYGETLILSGLSENVADSDHNVTPELWLIPGVGGLFGRHDVNTEKTSVLILVTPLKPVEAVLPRRVSRDGEIAEVLRLWNTLIDPSSDVGAIVRHVTIYGDPAFAPFDRSRREDISLFGPSDKHVMGEVGSDYGAKSGY